MTAKRRPDLGEDVGARASRGEGGPHGGARRKALPARRPWEESSSQWRGGGAGSGEVRPGNPLVSEVGRGPREYAGWLSSSTRPSTKARAHRRLRQVDMAAHDAQLSAKPFGARRRGISRKGIAEESHTQRGG
ncbi:leucine-rich repeat extensin-like protein 3 [Iris pallida]|uniref:Leucine-rich repeat extensin-like protein 3 n=1 Tax=Iris pallida TaxID=29817 RepID=A0AAX6IFV0_IRIPA|nr:leucine-rich repeat extensin-like protein 3 [Iris pallida]